jgi:hypothetical protein
MSSNPRVLLLFVMLLGIEGATLIQRDCLRSVLLIPAYDGFIVYQAPVRR